MGAAVAGDAKTKIAMRQPTHQRTISLILRDYRPRLN
jgi:hypothetical protein